MAEPTPIAAAMVAAADALEQAATRYPIERTGPRTPIPHLVRLLVLKRDKFRCDWCGSNWPGQSFHLDHIVPWSAGGSDDSTNLRILCPPCNDQRSNRRTDATYTRRMPCTPMCMPCMGYRDVTEADFDPDERQRVFCGSCSRVSWVALGSYWACRIH